MTNSPYFNNLNFERSPYATGAVVDENGLVLLNLSSTADGYALPNGKIVPSGLAGELYDNSGELINANDIDKYDVLIPAVTVKDNNYSISNMPDDAITINGITYVSASHLDDFEETKTSEGKSK